MLEIYVSTDVETDGPVAGKHSILSIGSAAFTADKEFVDVLCQPGTIAERVPGPEDGRVVVDAA